MWLPCGRRSWPGLWLWLALSVSMQEWVMSTWAPVTCPSCWLEVSASIAHTVAASSREMDSELGAWLLFVCLCDFLMFLGPFVCLVWPLTWTQYDTSFLSVNTCWENKQILWSCECLQSCACTACHHSVIDVWKSLSVSVFLCLTLDTYTTTDGLVFLSFPPMSSSVTSDCSFGLLGTLHSKLEVQVVMRPETPHCHNTTQLN